LKTAHSACSTSRLPASRCWKWHNHVHDRQRSLSSMVSQGLLCQGMPHTGRSRPSRSSTLSSPCRRKHSADTDAAAAKAAQLAAAQQIVHSACSTPPWAAAHQESSSEQIRQAVAAGNTRRHQVFHTTQRWGAGSMALMLWRNW
jgi:hypothetical protein